MKLSGFDQITGWISAIALSGLLFTGFWYFEKSVATKDMERNAARLAAAEKDLLVPLTEASREASPEEPAASDLKSTSSLNAGESINTFEDWGYIGHLAPWYWPTLNDKWQACGAKTGQSPIDISGSKLDEHLKALKFYYRHGVTHLVLHHQTIQGDVDGGSYLDWDGERFDLTRVFFRTPSEHKVNSLPWEMEAQLEHVAVTGKRLMLSVLITPGRDSEFLSSFSGHLPRYKDDIQGIERMNWQDLIPSKKTYWTYIGSTTTPPCTPDTRWIVMTEPVTTSSKLIDQFVLLQKSNTRPVFFLDKRELARSNR
jgi:carbonic anhydrase